MSKLLVGILSLVFGLVLGVFLIGPMMLGTAAGIGVATGLSAGICSTVTAAQEEGLLTAEQVDQVLVRAAQDMAGADGVPEDAEIVGTAAQCEEVMENLKTAAQN